MTSRIFQDEINAAVAEQAARDADGTDTSFRQVGDPEAGPQTIRNPGGYLVKSSRGITEAGVLDGIARGMGGGTFESITWERKDIFGRDVYRVQRGTRVDLVVYEDGQVGRPTFVGIGETIPPGGDPRFAVGGSTAALSTPGMTAGASLDDVKENWLTWIAEMSTPGSISGTAILTPETANNLRNQVTGWTGTPEDLQSNMELIARNTFPAPAPWQPIFGEPDYIGSGGGGGGGFAGPQYRAPDRRVVEEYARSELRDLVGTIPSTGMVNDLTNLYMTDHRRNFDSPDKEIDPTASVVEAIRDTTEYQLIHKLRPETADERSWVSDRRVAAARGGLTLAAQEQFAITQATTGGDVPDVVEAAALQQVQRSGSARGTPIEQAMRTAANNLFAGVVR